MSDPRSAGTASLPPTLGEGCTSRYDIDALGDEDGTEFPRRGRTLAAYPGERQRDGRG